MSTLLLTLAGFVLGAVVGSFLAVILIRWPDGRSALGGRSKCDRCGETLGPGELVPILSYLLQRGRCRRCGAAIDSRHLLIELAAAAIGIVAALAHPLPGALATALLGWWLLLIALMDLEYQWLPDRLTLPLLPLGWGVAWIAIGPALQDRLIGAAMGFLMLWLVAALYKRLRGWEGLGGGDPKLLAAIGAWLGWQPLPFVLLGAGLLGLAAVLTNWLRGQKVTGTDRLPLGTLMAIAAWPIWLLIAS